VTASAAKQISESLRAAIMDGRLKVDERLPTEEELAQRFKVSRPTVREALKRLAAQHLIRSRRGPAGGNFVSSPAPAPGTSLGPLSDIPDGEAKEYVFGTGRRVFSMLVVRRGGDARAYVNACPHVWLPLTYRSGSVVSADGEQLVCSNHFAKFSVEDGRALSGAVPPGCGLTRVPIHVDAENRLIIGDRVTE
jgi:nitrite reductase/ring-hydroxylating ferredoxin subunit